MTCSRAMYRVLVSIARLSVALVCGCSEPSSPTTGTETNWLAACSANSDCSAGSCVCSVCTLPCMENADCSGEAEGSACARDTGGPALLCPNERPVGLCLPECTQDLDCSDGLRCLDGSCIPAPAMTAPPATGGSPSVAPSNEGGAGGAPVGGAGGAGAGSGGAPTTAGAAPTGGTPATGGSAGSGGAPITGGAPPTGGTPSLPEGGTGGVGGDVSEPVPCDGLVGPTSPYATIQEAIDAEPSGATIDICPGTYLENLTITRSVTLVGVEGRDATIVDAAGTGSVVFVQTGAIVALRGLGVRGGVADYDAAGDGSFGGGGIVNLGTLALIDVAVVENEAEFGAGILNLGTLTVDGSLFASNSTTGAGGGIANGYPYVNNPQPASLRITTSEFRDNTATLGAGIMDTSDQNLEIYDSVMTGNSALGGGLRDEYGLLTMERVELRANELMVPAPVLTGLGLYLTNVQFTLTDVEFTDNVGPDAVGLFMELSTGLITRGAFLRNEATTGGASAILLFDGGSLETVDVDFGTGEDDNVPATAEVMTGDLFFEFGPGTSVRCTLGGCQ